MTARSFNPDHLANLVYSVHRASMPDLSKPYPKYCHSNADVARQDFWKGDPAALLGFQDDPEVHTVNLAFAEFVKNPQAAVGRYPVYVRADGSIFVETATKVDAIVVTDGLSGPRVPELNAPVDDTEETRADTTDAAITTALSVPPLHELPKKPGHGYRIWTAEHGVPLALIRRVSAQQPGARLVDVTEFHVSVQPRSDGMVEMDACTPSGKERTHELDGTPYADTDAVHLAAWNAGLLGCMVFEPGGVADVEVFASTDPDQVYRLHRSGDTGKYHLAAPIEPVATHALPLPPKGLEQQLFNVVGRHHGLQYGDTIRYNGVFYSRGVLIGRWFELDTEPVINVKDQG